MSTTEQYVNHRLLHRGIDFSVYVSTSDLGEERILKVLNSSSPASTQIAHFNNEFHITQKLNVQGVRKIIGQTQYCNCPALVMEYFEGEDLEELVRNGVDIPTFLKLAIPLSEIIGNIHLNHITHKDINGRNILVNRESGELRIIDFGMSSMLDYEHQSFEHPNLIRGTITHISPEQTGRMNRKVDYRSDIYSLGVTFFHMLTGAYPFISDDPLEIIHYHIAKEPDLEKLQYPFNQIIGKMLSKNADERYNSAFGIKSDLVECLRILNSKEGIKDFMPGRNDHVLTFTIRQKLYGRKEETEKLLSEFKEVCKGQTRLLLVAGYSGIGKTSLINEILRPVSIKKGFFASGKFNQYQRNIPYYAFLQAFQIIVDRLLTEPEDRLNEWKEKILKAVGINGQLIIDVIPSVKHIIGEQSGVQEMLASEANNRFNRALLNFIKVFAQQQHPLVLFMDDLQWADIASLNLIEQLMFQAQDHYLLLLGAYRDNEVDQKHLLKHSLENIDKNDGVVSTLQLKPLKFEEVNHLVGDSIESSYQETEKLSELVYKKTGGNPFFVSQFMYKLYNDGRITFSNERQQWIWNLDAIRNENITDNVVELMTLNILQLPVDTQRVIKLASCIGNEFDLQTLVTVSDTNPVEVGRLLWPSLEMGLIIPLDDNYKIFGSDGLQGATLTGSNARYSFLHDRIQQAAYSLIPPQDKALKHFDIGKTLLSDKDDAGLEDSLFDILNHINQGVHLVSDKGALRNFANLNHRAGKKAKASAAYSSSEKFYDKAAELLGENSFRDYYEFSFSVYLELAEVSYLNGDIEKAESLLELLLKNGTQRLDKANVYISKSIMYLMISNFSASKEACKDALALFDITVPEKITNEILQESFAQLEALRAGRPIAGFFELPQLTNIDQYTIFIIFFNYATPAYYTDQNLWIWIILKEIGISITYGNSDSSDAVYCAYGLILGSGLGDYDSGYAYGELGCRLNEKYNNLSNKSKICVIFGQMNSHWKRHYKYNLPMAKEGFHIGNETGDLTYAGTNAFHACWCLFLIGRPLKEVMEECNRYEDYFIKTRHNLGPSMIVEKQMVLALSGKTENLHSLTDAHFNEDEYFEKLKESIFLIPIHTYYIAKQRLYYHSASYRKVIEMADLAKSVNFSSFGMNYSPEEFYFEALAIIAVSREDGVEIPEKLHALEEMFQKWAANAPDNFLHKLELIRAERLSLQGAKEASEVYDKAIEHAHAGEFLHEEALANELAALHHYRNNNMKLAKAYMTESRNQYQVWEAMAKVRQIEQKYPHLLYGQGGIEYSRTKTVNLITSTQDLMLELDIQTVLKASTALSGEVKLENLLRTLINIAIENAGAQKGTILLKENKVFLIKAHKGMDGSVEVLQDIPANDFDDLSKSIVHYVIRTENSVVLDDAGENDRFSNDPYIANNHPKSILCMPIINKGNLIGILYLENNLTTNAFTTNRLDLLRLISGQIAISIDNSNLYENLEKKVRERTEELVIEKENSDKLLRNILPEEIAEELKKTGTAIPKSYEQVTILFTDFKGFTKSSEKLTPKDIIEKLDYCFANFDRIISKYNLEKIKTIGDSYMCAGGIPVPNYTNAIDAVKAGLEIQEFIETWNKKEAVENKQAWHARIGVNTGKVIAGVVGQTKFAYDIWGDAVNVASAMEQCGEVGKVNISRPTYELIKNDFDCVYRGKVKAKNKGELDMFFVQSTKGL